MNAKMAQISGENAAMREALNSLKMRMARAEQEIREEVAEEVRAHLDATHPSGSHNLTPPFRSQFEEMIAEIHEQYAEQRRKVRSVHEQRRARRLRSDVLHKQLLFCDERGGASRRCSTTSSSFATRFILRSRFARRKPLC